MPRTHVHGPLVPGLFVTEAIVFGASYYASRPKAYGDKVMGAIWAGSSASMLIAMPTYLYRKKNRKLFRTRGDRLWNGIMMGGMAYGFGRLAWYNLEGGREHSNRQRFWRNVAEIHAAYLVPICAGAAIEQLLNRPGRKRTSRVETLGYFTGQSAGLRLLF